MKTGKLFWGIFFIGLGGFSLLAYIGVNLNVDIDNSFTIPIILIILGLVILFKHQAIKSILILLAALISAYAIFNMFWDDDYQSITNGNDEYNYIENSLHANQSVVIDTAQTITKAKIIIFGAANEIKVTGVNTDNYLAKIISEKGVFLNVQSSMDSNSALIEVSQDKIKRKKIGKTFFKDIKLKLSDKPTWDFQIKSGATESKLDLRKLKVKNIYMKTAASDVDIYLGSRQKLTNIDLDIAAIDITIHIPKSSGCLINGDFILVDKHLRDFNFDGNKTYTSENFQQSENKVNINLHGTIADFTVKYY
jgi:hypothetical protein